MLFSLSMENFPIRNVREQRRHVKMNGRRVLQPKRCLMKIVCNYLHLQPNDCIENETKLLNIGRNSNRHMFVCVFFICGKYCMWYSMRGMHGKALSLCATDDN